MLVRINSFSVWCFRFINVNISFLMMRFCIHLENIIIPGDSRSRWGLILWQCVKFKYVIIDLMVSTLIRVLIICCWNVSAFKVHIFLIKAIFILSLINGTSVAPFIPKTSTALSSNLLRIPFSNQIFWKLLRFLLSQQ